MLEVRQTAIYAEWFAALRDRQIKVRIDIRFVGSRSETPAM